MLHIPTLETLRCLESEGLITVRAKDDLVICNYTQRQQFRGVWDDDLCICRGLILRVDPPWSDSATIIETVGIPFGKFFNCGERGLAPSGDIAEITEKLDGSLAIIYNNAGAWECATRGSFSSDQAKWATEYLERYDLSDMPTDWTLLCEAIIPTNRIVVHYGDREELVLLAIRNRVTGEDYSYATVRAVADTWGFPVVQTITDMSDMATVLDTVKIWDANREGVVLRMVDGTRWKVKSDAYRAVHALLNHITRKSVLEMLRDGTYDVWRETIPEEYAGDVDAWHDEAELTIEGITMTVYNDLLECAYMHPRKAFAEWVIANHRDQSQYYFAHYDGRVLRPLILKQLVLDA